MDEEIIIATEKLLKKLDSIDKFENKYGAYPYQEMCKMLDALRELTDSLPDIETPENQEELMQSELKRMMGGCAFNVEQYLNQTDCDFNTILSFYSISELDISGLRDWLIANKNQTQESIERLYQTKNVQNYELSLPVDIPAMRRQAEEFAAVHIQKYHVCLGKLLQNLTQVGGYLRDINAVPTIDGRSYFHSLTNNLAIGIPSICYMTEEGSLQIRERELISLYGHEGMGHALNQVITKNSGLPYFLTFNTAQTASTKESVAQFYEKVIFEDLKNAPETQKSLGIQHQFDEIYQETIDIAQLQEYTSKLTHYAITVVADKMLGLPQEHATLEKKIEKLNEVALFPKYPRKFVERHRYNFDSQGNLNQEMMCELRYCAQPVQRALEEFAKQGIKYDGDGRSKIDETFLKGFWTPIGFVNNARLSAQNK